MCPLETGLGSTFNETYFSEFQTAVNYITMRGGYAILDAHNYMRTASLPVSTTSFDSPTPTFRQLTYIQATTILACNPPPVP